ncbi:MAG: hypothetical protein GX547_01465 [Phycisphaerae bacterium]|nr:hypothetical protein [Phycisphaerae bacterium]
MMNRGKTLKLLLGQAMLVSWLIVLPGCPVEYCFDAKWDVVIKITSHTSGAVVADALVYYQAAVPDYQYQPVLTADADPALFAGNSASTDGGGLARLHIVEGFCGPPPWTADSFPTEPTYEYRVRVDAGEAREVLTLPIFAGGTATGTQFDVEVVSVEAPDITWAWQ